MASEEWIMVNGLSFIDLCTPFRVGGVLVLGCLSNMDWMDEVIDRLDRETHSLRCGFSPLSSLLPP